MSAAALVSVFCGSALALDSLGDLATPLADPLVSVPRELHTGKVLPGDDRPAACPVVKDFAEPLLLVEAVDLALCNNSQVRSAWAAIKVQAASVGTARAAYFPTLIGSAGWREDKTRYPDSDLNSRRIDSSPLNGAASWRLFDFGGRGAGLDAANQLLAAALAKHDAVLQKTLAAVIQAYFDTQTTRAAHQAKEAAETNARTTLETAKRREDKGAGSTGETLQAATALARATLDKNRAEGGYRKALAVLIYELGVPAGTRMHLVEEWPEVGDGEIAEELAQWLRQAERHHPALVAARSEAEAARSRVDVARSEGLPTVDASANYYEDGRLDQSATATRSQETVVGLTLTFPLFDGFSCTYKVRGAQAQVEQKEAERQDTEHQILMEVVKAHAEARSALNNLSASRTLLVTAEEALATTRRKYEQGAADILEILTTQTALADARQERIRCLADWRSARLHLLASAGLMGRGAVER